MASGDTLVTLYPADAESPTSSYATPDTRNAHPLLNFNDSVTNTTQFTFVLPRNYGGGGITLYLTWTAATATSGNVVWQSAFENMIGQDIDSDGYATAITWTAAATSGTSGIPTVTNQAHTNGAQIDSLAVGNAGRIQISRLGANGSDTMTGNAQLLSLELKET